MSIEILNQLIDICGCENVKTNEPMCRHTTFKIGGNADIFVTPCSEDALCETVKLCIAEGVKYTLLGNGSNVLVPDSGIRGVVISTVNIKSAVVNGTSIYASCGIMMSSLAALAAANSLSGIEFAGGIPGTFGGGLYMNAGAYGGELKDVVKYVRVMDADGNVCNYPLEKCEFGYRKSVFEKPGFLILGAEILLKPGENADILALMRDFATRRREKQPLEFPSAGSTFKRPDGHFAGKLIQDSGLAGYKIGGAQVSEKHCGFLINCGNATAEDMLRLINHVKTVVFEKFGVHLCEEVKLID